MKKYIDADLLEKRIDEAQESLQSNDDKIWKLNKPIYKGLCWARALLRGIPKMTAIEIAEEIKIKTVSRWQTIKSDEDLRKMVEKWRNDRYRMRFDNYLLEKVEVEE